MIIPAYNVEKYLVRCLDSVCRQSYKDIQIIVVDDGSNDGTGNILDEYAEKDNRIVAIHKENGGVAAARNAALDVAAGDVIAFADADDYMEPDMLQRLYESMLVSNADMVTCGYYEEYPDRTVKRRMNKGNKLFDAEEAYKEFFKMGGLIGGGCWNKLIKKEAIGNIRYKAYSMGEDVELLGRVLHNCGKVMSLDYAGYHYIHREESATQTRFRHENMHIIYVMDEMEEFIRKNRPLLLQPYYGFCASWYVAFLQVMKRSGEMKSHKIEQAELKNRIRKKRKQLIYNPYVYKVDKVLLIGFMINCFGLAEYMRSVISRAKERK